MDSRNDGGHSWAAAHAAEKEGLACVAQAWVSAPEGLCRLGMQGFPASFHQQLYFMSSSIGLWSVDIPPDADSELTATLILIPEDLASAVGRAATLKWGPLWMPGGPFMRPLGQNYFDKSFSLPFPLSWCTRRFSETTWCAVAEQVSAEQTRETSRLRHRQAWKGFAKVEDSATLLPDIFVLESEVIFHKMLFFLMDSLSFRKKIKYFLFIKQ